MKLKTKNKMKIVALIGFPLGVYLLYRAWLMKDAFLMYLYQFLGVIAVIFATCALGAIYTESKPSQEVSS